MICTLSAIRCDFRQSVWYSGYYLLEWLHDQEENVVVYGAMTSEHHCAADDLWNTGTVPSSDNARNKVAYRAFYTVPVLFPGRQIRYFSLLLHICSCIAPSLKFSALYNFVWKEDWYEYCFLYSTITHLLLPCYGSRCGVGTDGPKAVGHRPYQYHVTRKFSYQTPAFSRLIDYRSGRCNIARCKFFANPNDLPAVPQEGRAKSYFLSQLQHEIIPSRGALPDLAGV